MPNWVERRRALARRSNIEIEGVSSIYKGAFSRSFTLVFSTNHSCSSSFPVRNFSDESPVSEEIRRVISCTADISSEKKATGMFCPTAILRAIERVRAVLPIPGRAAMIIRSLACQPEVSWSSLVKPEGTPLKPSVLLESSCIFFSAFSTKSPAASLERFRFPWVTS